MIVGPVLSPRAPRRQTRGGASPPRSFFNDARIRKAERALAKSVRVPSLRRMQRKRLEKRLEEPTDPDLEEPTDPPIEDPIEEPVHVVPPIDEPMVSIEPINEAPFFGPKCNRP